MFALICTHFSVTHGEVWSTLDDEAVSKAVQPNCTTLLVQVHLLLWQEMSNPAARTQPSKYTRIKMSTLWKVFDCKEGDKFNIK